MERMVPLEERNYEEKVPTTPISFLFLNVPVTFQNTIIASDGNLCLPY